MGTDLLSFFFNSFYLSASPNVDYFSRQIISYCHPAVKHSCYPFIQISHLFSGEMHALYANGDPDGEATWRFQRPGSVLLFG